MRTVDVYEWVKPAGETKQIRTYQGKAKFHQFGMDFEEFDDGAVGVTTAIVEWLDGKVSSVPVDMIEFTD